MSRARKSGEGRCSGLPIAAVVESTRTPRSASWSAMTRPIPRDPPVTSAVSLAAGMDRTLAASRTPNQTVGEGALRNAVQAAAENTSTLATMTGVALIITP